MIIFQSVLNCLHKINPIIKIYVLSLMLSKSRKNCTSMAESIGISTKSLYYFLSESTNCSKEIEKNLLTLAKNTRIKSIPRTLIVDPSTIIKTYAKKMENLCYDRSGCTKKTERCLVPVYLTVADSNITIPIKIDFWVQEKVIGKDKYKSKIAISKALILSAINQGIEFDYISLDGAFATKEMFDFFKDNNLQFIARMPSNRLIETCNGIRKQLKYHPEIKLKRNEREKTIIAKVNKYDYFITIQKRQSVKWLWERVFLISNMKLSAKKHVEAYDLRWPMEKANRTCKQKFGAGECQATSASKQTAHIMAGFLAYAILGFAKNYKKSKNVDEIINNLRKFHYNELADEIRNTIKLKNLTKIDSVAKSVQNSFQNLFKNYDYTKSSVNL